MEARFNLTYSTMDGREHSVDVVKGSPYTLNDGRYLGYQMPSGEKVHVKISKYKKTLLDQFRQKGKCLWGKTDMLLNMKVGDKMTVPFIKLANYESWKSIRSRLQKTSINPATGRQEIVWTIRSCRELNEIYIIRTR